MSWLEYNDPFSEDDGFDNMEEKIRYYQKIIRNSSIEKKELPNDEVLESLVDYCISAERYKEALEFCGIWLFDNPDSSDANHKKAIILSQLNKPDQAIKFVEKAIKLNPSERDYTMTKALILEQLGNISSGLEIIDSILASDPGNEEAMLKKAMIMQSASQFSEALKILSYLENIGFSPEEVFQEIANCYQMLSDFDSSAKYYIKAIELSPYDYLIWFNYGVMFGNKGAHYHAIECYQTVLAIKKDFYPALFNLANAYTSKSRIVEAIETYMLALKSKPDDIDTLFNLAGTYADNKQYFSAIEYYTKVISNDPINYLAYFGRGYCYDALDDYDNALIDFEITLKFTPDSKPCLLAKADLLFNIGKVKESLPIYLKVLELDPHNEHSIFDAAYIYYELGDFSSAIHYLESLLDVTISYSDGWYLLAKVHTKLGNEKKSIQAITEAIRLDATKYEEFLKDFKDLSNDFNSMLKKVDKALKPGKSFFR